MADSLSRKDELASITTSHYDFEDAIKDGMQYVHTEEVNGLAYCRSEALRNKDLIDKAMNHKRKP